VKNKLMAAVEADNVKADQPSFQVGDTVDVHQRILEGEKERVQVFNGVVIARKGGGARETFTVRRIVQGEGVERIFPLNSPKIAKIEVKRSGRTRRAKLYYLRKRVGKATRLRERTAKGENGANGSPNGAPAGSNALGETAST
jgi:large subunit ribosomal protein L19